MLYVKTDFFLGPHGKEQQHGNPVFALQLAGYPVAAQEAEKEQEKERSQRQTPPSVKTPPSSQPNHLQPSGVQVGVVTSQAYSHHLDANSLGQVRLLYTYYSFLTLRKPQQSKTLCVYS